jgi:hypothetical protein
MRWLLPIVCTLFFLWVSCLNYVCAIRALRGGAKSSMVPLIGGGAGALALILSPVSSVRDFWFLPLLLDPGSALLLSMSLLFWILPKTVKRPGDHRPPNGNSGT